MLGMDLTRVPAPDQYTDTPETQLNLSCLDPDERLTIRKYLDGEDVSPLDLRTATNKLKLFYAKNTNYQPLKQVNEYTVQLPSGETVKLDVEFDGNLYRLRQRGGKYKVCTKGNRPFGRIVIGAKPGTVVSHINGDWLDCRTSNLVARKLDV
jgi:hypothetical protein